MKKDIHKGGRPPIQRPIEFYENLLIQYETMTLAQMSKIYKVTRPTVSRWLRQAREVVKGE